MDSFLAMVKLQGLVYSFPWQNTQNFRTAFLKNRCKQLVLEQCKTGLLRQQSPKVSINIEKYCWHSGESLDRKCWNLTPSFSFLVIKNHPILKTFKTNTPSNFVTLPHYFWPIHPTQRALNLLRLLVLSQ